MDKKIFIAIIVASFFITSCNNDLLNQDNPTTISSTDVWKDQTLIELYVNNIYTYVPGWDYNTFNNISDEARSNYPGGPNSILVGDWNAINNPMDIWASTYQHIRVCNDFFANIVTSPVSQDVKKEYSSQVRFLRALFYFELVKRYGGVPLITTAQSLGDNLLVSRSTEDSCFNFIVSQLDTAITNLPEDADRGKATKGAAMALKAKVLLYYASPLYNPSNDISRWQQAADAAKAVMDLKIYQLYPDLKNLWLDASNKESIFEKEYALPETSHGWDAEVKPVWLAKGDAGQCSPLQELVNAFPMKNGLLINQPESGYDPTHPYVGRDDRFYDFIAYNQSKIAGIPARPVPGVQPGSLDTNYVLNIYKGGSDYDSLPSFSIYNTATGYLTIKATNPNNTIYGYGYGSTQPWIIIRYAGILLDYAEAENEAKSTPDPSVYDALNQIRERAGITNPLPPMTQSAMRAEIHNERYVELCFEGQRYWDLRRWKTAESVLNGKEMTGVVITKHPDGTFTYDYEPVDPQPLVFDPKMYLFPIPQSEITKDPNLQQNPGW
jgi:hypothetical protein